MREILFRGKRETDGKWIYGYYADDNAHDVGFPCIFPLRNYPDDGDWAVIRETVGQYIGLTDKNGTKIFEGDIIKHYRNEDGSITDVGSVYWDNPTCQYFRTTLDDADHYKMCSSAKYEVIGNIHDNPELLEGHNE